MVRDRMLVINH